VRLVCNRSKEKRKKSHSRPNERNKKKKTGSPTRLGDRCFKCYVKPFVSFFLFLNDTPVFVLLYPLKSYFRSLKKRRHIVLCDTGIANWKMNKTGEFVKAR
jgi:hypothetical protein